MNDETIIITIAAVLAGGVLADWLGWRLRVPPVVFLLTAGLVAGPLTGVFDPDETLGDLLFPVVSIAVAVILFEGSLSLDLGQVREAGATVLSLLTIGAAITLGLGTLAAHYILDVSWELAGLLAAVLVVTGPTVIGPIVRTIGLRGRAAAVLEAEGTLIDPLGAILAVVAFEAFFRGSEDGGVDLIATLVLGGALGALAAGVVVVALARFIVPDQLHHVFTLAVVVGAFALGDTLQAEAGLVAVTVMGVTLASQERVEVGHILEFKESLRTLFIAGVFVLLGARIDSDTLRDLEWRTVAFLGALVLVVRPVSVFFATLRSSLGRRERLFIAATAPGASWPPRWPRCSRCSSPTWVWRTRSSSCRPPSRSSSARS